LRRCALIRVHVTDEPAIEEPEAGPAQSTKDDTDENPLAIPSPTIATALPEFWLAALGNHVSLSGLITDRDGGALKYLAKLHIEYLYSSEPKPGFRVRFEFSQEVGYSGDFVYGRAIGTEIKWKDEKVFVKGDREATAANETKVSAIFCTFDSSSEVRFARQIARE
jgi:nucleosome assembly protein 1-like 1